MATARRPEKPSAVPQNLIPSSSPAFGTPVHPINPRRTAPIRAPPALKPPVRATVLPIELPPATLRPLAFRTFTKKYNLTLTSSALAALAGFIGKHCGAGWREEGLAEKVLEEVAKSWKKSSGQVIVEGEGEALKSILKALEGSMSGGRIVNASNLSRQGSFNFGPDSNTNGAPRLESRPPLDHNTSFGISRLEVEDKDEEEEALKDPREWMKVIGAFEQPKQVYNVSKKHFDRSTTKPSLFPDPSHKTDLFRQRYHIVHQRILRNETFQSPTFSAARSATLSRTGSLAMSGTNTITPIANLLGRGGSTHLLLGMITISPTGTLTLSDLTGTIALDLQHARPIPEDGTYFAPGMIVLVDGSYEENYGDPTAGSTSTLGGTGGIGGTIGGKFIGFSVGHPPCERRSATLGGADDVEKNAAGGPAFGWTDFLGVGSERATGSRMNRIATKLLTPDKAHNIVIASDLHLDIPSTLSALRTLLRTYSPTASEVQPVFPLAIVLMGNFSSRASLAGVPGAGSIEYKEHFDALASVLSEFPQLLAHTTLVFAPGDHDAWPSAFSAGAATPLPRKQIPELFTNRIRRAVREANTEVWGSGKKSGKEGEVVWTSNPSRLTWFGVKGEMAILRDDVMGRLHRTSIRFSKPEAEADDDDVDMENGNQDAMDINAPATQLEPTSAPKSQTQEQIDTDTLTARALTRTLLSQSHLSPFPLSVRPLHWDFAHALNLYPLPSSVVIADSEAPAFVVKYCGCTVMNPGSIDGSDGQRGGEGRARWVEFDVRSNVGVVRTEE
ncbi:DNA polymeras-like protein epsilon subunit B [Bimuria novae-zelandiae CBS 107.79]|uniref:DNA polymerase epsilon subunit B n=1 Tax=Bimuria novae-zelandiae CBS 107.79 TaxID=1447943 RepID=A0A6A5VRZ9_9PLEO|nr:DNA polymeras-like protein epsilon subunit B [Bimuria novae-zelandiae CBS 107.79]